MIMLQLIHHWVNCHIIGLFGPLKYFQHRAFRKNTSDQIRYNNEKIIYVKERKIVENCYN